jgi:hypothetical protein
MALDDYRKLIEVGASTSRAPYVALEVTDNLERPILLEVGLGGLVLGLALDEGEAGELFDALAGAIAYRDRPARGPEVAPADTPTEAGN